MATPCVLPSAQFNATLLTQETLRFFPPRRVGRARAPGDPVAAAVVALDDAIWSSRHPPTARDCETRGIRLSIREGGFGSTLNALVKPFLHGLLNDRVSLGAQPGVIEGSRQFHHALHLQPAAALRLFRNRSRCPSENLDCFLQPLSNCSEEQRLRLPAQMLGGRYLELEPHAALLRGAPAAARPLLDLMATAGHFNLISLLLANLLRPSDAVAARIAQAKRTLGWPNVSGPPLFAYSHRPLLLAVHLRAGDSCSPEALGRHNRSCEPLAAYLPAVREADPVCTLIYIYINIYLSISIYLFIYLSIYIDR